MSHWYQCDTLNIGSRHMNIGMRHLVSKKKCYICSMKQRLEIKTRNNDNSRIHNFHSRSIHTHIGHHHILCHDTWVPELSWWSLEGRVQPCRFHQAGTVLYLPVPGINAYHPAEPVVSAEWLASEPCIGMQRNSHHLICKSKKERYYENSQSFMLNCIAICKKSGTFASRFTNRK